MWITFTFKEIIESLMHLTTIKPDIMLNVYTSKPTQLYLQVVKRITR